LHRPASTTCPLLRVEMLVSNDGHLGVAEVPALPGRRLGVFAVDYFGKGLGESHDRPGVLELLATPDDRMVVEHRPPGSIVGGDPAAVRQPPRRFGEDRKKFLLMPVAPFAEGNIVIRSLRRRPPEVAVPMQIASRSAALPASLRSHRPSARTRSTRRRRTPRTRSRGKRRAWSCSPVQPDVRLFTGHVPMKLNPRWPDRGRTFLTVMAGRTPSSPANGLVLIGLVAVCS
jgi:hypothetical protein